MNNTPHVAHTYMHAMNTRLTYILLTLIACLPLRAQQHIILSDDIASLQVMMGDDWQHMPVIRLGGDVPLNVSFDDLTHQYRRLRYTIQHCEYDWSISSDLFTSDYLEGYADPLIIDDAQESINTATLYTHYHLQIPNNNVQLKLSGNYLLSIYDDNANDDDPPLLTVCFMVTEQSMPLSMRMTTDTRLGINAAHQQLEMALSYGSLNVSDPDTQLHTVVLQNQRWHSAQWDPRPTYRTATGLQWTNRQGPIFPAGNEHHKFEYLDIHRNSMGVDHFNFDGTNYNAWVIPDVPRANYVYDVSGQGSFIIRNSDNYESNVASEYFIAHFSLRMPHPLPYPLYVDGLWTHGQLSPSNEMQWNADTHSYECAIPLKLGYYSYQYVVRHPDGTVHISPTEGNYFETNNAYQVLVYHRPPGARTDRLVAYGCVPN